MGLSLFVLSLFLLRFWWSKLHYYLAFFLCQVDQPTPTAQIRNVRAEGCSEKTLYCSWIHLINSPLYAVAIWHDFNVRLLDGLPVDCCWHVVLKYQGIYQLTSSTQGNRDKTAHEFKWDLMGLTNKALACVTCRWVTWVSLQSPFACCSALCCSRDSMGTSMDTSRGSSHVMGTSTGLQGGLKKGTLGDLKWGFNSVLFKCFVLSLYWLDCKQRRLMLWIWTLIMINLAAPFMVKMY